MPVSNQDFNNGFDLTGVNPISGADINLCVENGTPADERGIVVYSIDTALNTPVIPDATIIERYKRYLWLRIPHPTADDTTPQLYAWDDEIVAGDLMNWVPVVVDISTLEALANQALSEAQSAQATSNTALATANIANATAATALSNANDAITTAENVATDASNALTAATNAQTAATAASDVAADALSVATAANATATNALNQVQANRLNKYIRITEQYAANTSPSDPVAGANIRQLNTTTNDAGAFVVSLAAGIATLKAGTYKVTAKAIGRNVNGHQLYLVNDDDDSTLIIGTPVFMNGETINTMSFVDGVITLSDETAVRLDHYFTGGNTRGMGTATNIGPADKKEVFAVLELEKLN